MENLILLPPICIKLPDKSTQDVGICMRIRLPSVLPLQISPNIAYLQGKQWLSIFGLNGHWQCCNDHMVLISMLRLTGVLFTNLPTAKAGRNSDKLRILGLRVAATPQSLLVYDKTDLNY